MPKAYQPNDKWSRKAAAEGFRARSVYKLIELDQKMGLLKPGMRVLDIGAAPGSWLQYTAEKIGETGKILAIDLTPIKPVAENVVAVVQDIEDEAGMNALLKKENMETVDLVLSDIAPNTSGVKDVDQWRSVELSTAVFALAERLLRRHGRCVVKVFRGADFDEFLGSLKETWKDVRITTVKASRDRSREVYVIGSKP